VQGYPATNGTAALRTFAPPTDAALVTRLRNEGAIVLGKTNLHELSMGFTSDNPHFGTARNPYDPTRHPGGSSGGTGIAVATQCAPIGIAEDTGGSIRVPAAACGVAGFRPTHGRYPNEGTLPLQPIFDQLGPIARRVSDIVLFDGVITGESVTLAPTPLRGLRLGIMRGFHDLVLDDDTARVWQEVERRLADAGVLLVDVQIPEMVNVWNTIAVPMILNDAVPAITDALARFETGVTMQQLRDGASPEVRGLMQLAGRVEPNADVRQRLLLARSSAQQRIAAAITSADVRALIFPAMPLIPQRKQDRGPVTVNGRQVPHDEHLVRNIAPCSTFGMAGLVVPAALGASGLPVCVEIDGVPGSDRSVLAIGLALEALLGPVSAPRIG
jgi:indoleacetamide hydrolase